MATDSRYRRVLDLFIERIEDFEWKEGCSYANGVATAYQGTLGTIHAYLDTSSPGTEKRIKLQLTRVVVRGDEENDFEGTTETNLILGAGKLDDAGLAELMSAFDVVAALHTDRSTELFTMLLGDDPRQGTRKAELVAQTIYEGTLDMVHDGGHRVPRLLVDGMVITVDGGKVYAYQGETGDDREHLGWVDVPIRIVELAREHVLASLALDSEMAKLVEIMSKPEP